MTGPQAEAYLAARGLTLGHFPQSFEYATLGGFAATRSAGQASSGYGRFDELVEGLRLVTPAGEVVVAGHPATAAGPSDPPAGARLGGTPRGDHRGHRQGAARAARSRATRAGRSRRSPPASPPCGRSRRAASPPTSPGSATARRRASAWPWPPAAGRWTSSGVATSGCAATSGGCLLIVGWDSDALLAGARQAEAASAAAPPRGHPAGRVAGPVVAAPALPRPLPARRPARRRCRWSRPSRLRSSWAALHPLHDAVDRGPARHAVRRRRAPLIGCHVSHVYPSGRLAVLHRAGRGRPRPARAAGPRPRRSASRGDPRQRRHHHPPPRRRHRPPPVPHARGRRRRRRRPAGARLAELDPTGIMNPGKLIPD